MTAVATKEAAEEQRPSPQEASIDDVTIEVAPMPRFGWMRNIAAWSFSAISCLTLGAPVVALQALLLPLGLANRWGDFTVLWWTGFVRWLWNVEIVVDGVENITPGQTYVLASNHRSHLDPVACLLGLKDHLRFGFIMKRSLSLIPIFGWFIWMNGYVPIDRGRSSRKKDQLKTGVKYLKRGRSVMMYPEGTRSPDHRFRSFKKGTFVLAIRAGVPVLPVVISGAASLWPKPSLSIRPGKVRVEVLPPVSTDGIGIEDRDVILERVRDAMVRRYRTSPDAPPLEERPALLEALRPKS